jgi:hypothetical protein
MTATVASGSQLAVGARRTAIYTLNASGYPDASSPTSAYAGIEANGFKSMGLTIPEPRRITHVGEDRVLQADFLPPTDAASAEIRVAPSDMALISALTGASDVTFGTSHYVVHATDEQGEEPTVGILSYQQSLDTSSGARRYRWIVIPKARAIPMPPGMGDAPEDYRYAISPSVTSQHLWGAALVTGTDGASSCQFVEGMSVGRPNLVAFKGNGSATAFDLPAGFEIVANDSVYTNSVKVWVDGVLKTGGGTDYTVTDNNTITMTAAPASGAILTIWYEY